MKATVFSIVRLLLAAIGAFLVGKNIFGTAIDDSLWQTIIGIVMGLVSMIWGIMDKTATIEGIQSALRTTIVFVGGLLVAAGKWKDETVQLILGIITVIVPYIYGRVSAKKSQDIATGELGVKDLSGVRHLPKDEPLRPVVTTPRKKNNNL